MLDQGDGTCSAGIMIRDQISRSCVGKAGTVAQSKAGVGPVEIGRLLKLISKSAWLN